MKSFHQLDRQLEAVQPWRCSGILRSAPVASLSFLAAFRAFAQPSGDPFEKLQLCSSPNLSVLAPANWPCLNGKRTTQVESSLPSVETLRQSLGMNCHCVPGFGRGLLLDLQGLA